MQTFIAYNWTKRYYRHYTESVTESVIHKRMLCSFKKIDIYVFIKNLVYEHKIIMLILLKKKI